MLQATGSENEGWIRLEDIAKFSCEDLRIIDQLWLESSQGKFGFSVQKELLEFRTGILENFDRENFRTQVGWRQGDRWEIFFGLRGKFTLCCVLRVL